MDWARIHEGIRRMRFADVLERTERSELSQMEAAELLGMSERTFRRWPGSSSRGWSDGFVGPAAWASRYGVLRWREIERMLGLYRDLYRGFTVKHFHEHLLQASGTAIRWATR